MDPAKLVEIADQSLQLLEKAAAEADTLEAEAIRLRAENKQLKSALAQKTASASSPVAPAMALKVAQLLEDNQMLAEGMTAEKLASLYTQDPNRLADIALRLLEPAVSEGAPMKRAAAPETKSPDGGKIITFNGKTVIDHDGWANVLKR